MAARIAFPGRGRAEEPEWTVWLTVVICLLIGWVIQSSVVGRTQSAAAGAGSLTYPAKWVPTSEEGALFAATDLDAGLYGARVSVREIPKADLTAVTGPNAGQDSLSIAASSWSLLRSQDLEGYRILQITPTTLQGREAMAIEYAYLTDAPQGATGGVMPGLMHAYDTVVASGDNYAILTVAVEQGSDESLDELNRRLIGGWQVP